VAPAPGERSVEALTRAVDAKEVEGAVILPADLAAAERFEAIVRRQNPKWKSDVTKHVHEEARRARAAARGLDAQALSGVDAPVTAEERITKPATKTSRADRVAAIMVIVLVIVALFTAVTYMGIGISGEKQARVTEVVISAIRPQSWIDGKIAAYTVIGLTQVASWGVTLFGVALFFLSGLPPAVSPAGLAITLVFAVAGFAFYTAFFAMIMATIKDLQSTSKFQAYLVFLPFIPLMIMDGVIENPDSAWAVTLSQLPFFSPMLMPARWAVNGAAPWEVATGLVILLVSFHFVRLAAGHAFRVAMLMYGKELTLPELWRWARS
jgi:ABC-2 type transport system permease protein